MTIVITEPWCGYSSPYLGRCHCGDAANHEPGGIYYKAGRLPDATPLLPEWDGTVSPRGMTVALTMMAHSTPPLVVVEFLRLLHPCQQCGARALAPCVRGLGEVRGTHLQRGEG